MTFNKQQTTSAHQTGRVSTVRASALQRIVASLVLAATVFAPLAALAQDALPGGTIPDAADTTSAGAATDALPAAPFGVSGGALDASADSETGVAEVVEAIEADSVTLERIATVDSSMVTQPAVQGPLSQELTNARYLPLMQFDHNTNRMAKLGFGAGRAAITSYQDIRKLNAGWYVNWSVSPNPPRPGMEFVQMIRVHQAMDTTKVYNAATGQMCGVGVTADRTICPYASPASYIYSPTKATIQQAAINNPGAIWLIGNEMERYDWVGGRQDEITPEVYAYAFRDLRAIIKAADPTARVAIGGVIQFTPLRQQWLDRVWTRYAQIAGHPIDQDIDVFNMHNFIGSEFCQVKKNPAAGNRNERECTGMGIPVGVTGTQVGAAQLGSYVGQDNRHIDMTTFATQVKGFRAWMKSKNANNVNKPLIVTEYGVLYQELCAPADAGCRAYYQTDPQAQPWGWVDFTNPDVVQEFMVSSFNYFNDTKDCDLASQAAFDCKLVQRWAWFGLEDIGWGFNQNGALLHVNNGMLTETGQIFANWAASK